MQKFTALSLALAFLIASCSSAKVGSVAPSADSHTIVPTPLTEVEANHRQDAISDISYSLAFHLDDQTTRFSGSTQIHFKFSEAAKEADPQLFLDFYQGELNALRLNGQALADFKSATRYDGNRIYLKTSELKAGANQIEIEYTHAYSSNGHGLHHFIDPIDKAVYTYSDLEPYFAHHLFPCFDQPNLKALFQLTVDAPKKWQIVTNTRETKITDVAGGMKEWTFPQTQKIATYVFALIAGEYQAFSADANGIPLRLFARKSLSKYVEAKEWFDVTRKGLAFYGKTFGRAYPFLKYDQILVPEFDEGAMENVGAVTFSERMLYRTKKTRLSHEGRASTILHEMAHMWFGDLVTMNWWNGLWLNESFATFMSAWAMSETHPIKETTKQSSWESFVGIKSWAYWQDQLVTTHPIELPVIDTDHAFVNFDGITYGKGAAVIKQLRYYLGDENFTKGIQLYFKKFAFQNTHLDDFIGSLAEASGKDLSAWKTSWLMTSGVNTVEAHWACENGKISKMNLLQFPAENSTVLRPHRTEIGLYRKNVLAETIPATYETADTAIDQAIGHPCPDMVFPNANDQDYVKVGLDPKTLTELTNHISEVKDALSKKMFWFTLGEMVTDGKVSAKNFADLAMKQLPSEKELTIQQSVLEVLSNRIPDYLNSDLRNTYYAKLESFALAGLQNSAPGSDSQLVWFRALVEFAHTDAGKKVLRDLLDGKLKIPKLKIDQEVRWMLVTALAKIGAPDAEALIDHEAKADPTEMGKKSALAAQVVRPDADLKAKWADVVFAGAATGSSGNYNTSDLRTIMSKFHQLGQEATTEAMYERYFKFLPEAAHSRDEMYRGGYTSEFFPGLCNQKTIDDTVTALKQLLPISAEKNLKMMKQETERCIRARRL